MYFSTCQKHFKLFPTATGQSTRQPTALPVEIPRTKSTKPNKMAATCPPPSPWATRIRTTTTDKMVSSRRATERWCRRLTSAARCWPTKTISYRWLTSSRPRRIFRRWWAFPPNDRTPPPCDRYIQVNLYTRCGGWSGCCIRQLSIGWLDLWALQ